MKRIAVGLICLFVLSAETKLYGGPPPIDNHCSLTIRYASYSSGPDRKTFEAVNELIADNPKIVSESKSHWGREGEFDQCLVTKSKSDTQELFERIKTLIPAYSKQPTQVFTNTGHNFSSQWPRD